MNSSFDMSKHEKILDVRRMARIGVLSAISVALMFLEIPLWFAPGFYKIDLSELPILIGAFAMGPMAGVVMELIKNLLFLLIHTSSTAGVGELANFLIGCALVVPSAWIYSRRKTKRTAVLGLAVGVLSLILVGCLLNYFVLLPVYAIAYHMPVAALVEMGSKVNPAIGNLGTFVLLAVAPFNLLKGTIVSALTLLIYKRVSPILHK